MRSPFGERCAAAWRDHRGYAAGFSSNVLLAGPDAALGETRLYVVHDAELDAVKIGTSRSPKQRLSNLRVGNPRGLTLEVDVLASTGIERIAHEYLAEDRIEGEWFRCTPLVLTVCEVLYSVGDWERMLTDDGTSFDSSDAAAVLTSTAEWLLTIVAETEAA